MTRRTLLVGALLLAGSAARGADQVGEAEELPDAAAEDTGPALVVTPGPTRTFSLGGYVDFGFFVPTGNGAGWIQDTGSDRAFPGDAERYGWVFLGDILAPAVNSRGEPADLGEAPGVTRADGIDSDGAAGFIANEVNFTATAGVGRSAVATTSVNFTPRTGSAFSFGDTFDVDLAQIEWMPTASQRTSIFVGKMESAIGIEYRDRKARDRFGVTPSLLARYTTGTPLGLKVRSKLGPDDRLVVAAAVTNGSPVVEPFHFHDEVDSNDGKTASGRLSCRLPVIEAELGVSGAVGPQDRARDLAHVFWLVGVDLIGRVGPVELKAQWLTGGARGETDRRYDEAHRAYGLDLKGGGYLELDWMATPLVGLMARGEFRNARVWLGDADAPPPAERAERLYITKSWRGTLGVRLAINAQATLKAEYLLNGEYGGVPAIRNDVFTSSLVWVY